MPSWRSSGVGRHNIRSKGLLVEAIGPLVSELHEICQVEGKRHFDPDS